MLNATNSDFKFEQRETTTTIIPAIFHFPYFLLLELQQQTGNSNNKLRFILICCTSHYLTMRCYFQRTARTVLGNIVLTFVVVNLLVVCSSILFHHIHLIATTHDYGSSSEQSHPSILPPAHKIHGIPSKTTNIPYRRLSGNATMAFSNASYVPQWTEHNHTILRSNITTFLGQASQTQPQPVGKRTSSSSMNSRKTSDGRLKTLERLKQVLGINETMEVLQKINAVSRQGRSDIPSWSNMERLYGYEFPQILGLDRCQRYRTSKDPWVAPAGLFHSGTNLLAGLLASTCRDVPTYGQVPYGKHNPIQASTVDHYRVPTKDIYQQVPNITQILPIVMVRHPLDWMQSMCRQKYAVSWKKPRNDTSEHTSDSQLPCPSLETSVVVDLYRTFEYDNLLDFWAQWYQDYLDYEGPRLMVRLEDLVYAPQETLYQICECVGGTFRFDPRVLEERQGGVVREQDRNNNRLDFLIKAWIRHSKVSVETTLSSSSRNQELFRQIASKDPMQQLLDLLHYRIDQYDP